MSRRDYARPDYLFSEGDIRESLNAQRLRMVSEIDAEGVELLGLSADDYLKQIVEKYSITVPTLHTDQRSLAERGDSTIDVSGRFDYAPRREEGPVYVKGTYVTIAIPFDGDPNLFRLKLPSSEYNPPRGSVVGNELHLTYSRLPQDQQQLKSEIDGDVKRLENFVRDLRSNIEQHNGCLEPLARETIQKRKTKLLNDQKLVESLGIPLKKRAEPIVQPVPLVRKPLHVEKPKISERGFTPEPTMPSGDYADILTMIRHLSLVIERNPHTFVEMQESDIRNIILVLLNAMYEGTATGETFNGAGKTDILLRHEGRNLFIAECKFWQGEQELLQAIDQLLGYATWRDTKTALVIFNRNRDMTAVLTRIQDAVKKHPCYKRDLGQRDETTFQYRFRQVNDPNRELFLTIMVFDVPRKNGQKQTGDPAKEESEKAVARVGNKT